MYKQRFVLVNKALAITCDFKEQITESRTEDGTKFYFSEKKKRKENAYS